MLRIVYVFATQSNEIKEIDSAICFVNQVSIQHNSIDLLGNTYVLNDQTVQLYLLNPDQQCIDFIELNDLAEEKRPGVLLFFVVNKDMHWNIVYEHIRRTVMARVDIDSDGLQFELEQREKGYHFCRPYLPTIRDYVCFELSRIEYDKQYNDQVNVAHKNNNVFLVKDQQNNVFQVCFCPICGETPNC